MGQWQRFLFGWGAAGGGDGGAAPAFDGDGLKICDRCSSFGLSFLYFFVHSAFFLLDLNLPIFGLFHIAFR
jgi:hypothetical protein